MDRRHQRKRIRHAWRLTPSRARALQERLAACVRQQRLRRRVRLVAGADVAFTPDRRECVAAIVVWDVAAGKVVETASARRALSFPYVPGLLSFREAPAVLAAIRHLRSEPDVFMLDGQGRAHPRRCGLASHVGLWLDRPSIGCAKSRLCGVFEPPGAEAGSWSPLWDESGREIIGAVLRTRAGVKPVFVSVGHRVSLDDAIAIVMGCVTRYRLPEPTRLADHLVRRLTRGGPPGTQAVVARPSGGR